MIKTFHLDGEYLQEDARIKRPFAANYNGIRNAEGVFRADLDEYNSHLASLSRIPILPGSKWEKTEGLVELIDFKVIFLDDSMTGIYQATAVPLPAPKQERMFTLDEAIEIYCAGFSSGAYGNVYTAGRYYQTKKVYFKEKFNIEIDTPKPQ